MDTRTIVVILTGVVFLQTIAIVWLLFRVKSIQHEADVDFDYFIVPTYLKVFPGNERQGRRIIGRKGTS